MCALETSASFHEEEDLALVRKAQRGDQSAFEVLLKEKLSLIEKLALEFASSPLTFEDFYRIGKETLRKSIQMFDDRRGTRFGSFAYWGLKHAFQKATDKAKQKSSSSSSGFSVLGEALTSALENVPHETLPVQGKDSNQIREEHPAISSNEDTNEEAMSFSLDEETPHVAHTRPISFDFLGNKYPVNSWIDFLVQIATLAYNGQHGDLLKEATPSEIAFTTRHCISPKPDGMIQPKRIADDLWIEGCFNAKQLVDFAKWITWWCNIDEHSVTVSYEKRNAMKPSMTPTIHTSNCMTNDIPATTSPVEHIGTSDVSSSIRLSDQLPLLSSTKPIKLIVSEKQYSVSTWREVMITIAKLSCKKDNGYTLKQLLVNGRGPIGLRNSSDTLHTPAQICEGLWIESQHNANYLIVISQKILEAYSFNTSKVSVDYGPTELTRKSEQKLHGKIAPSIQKPKQETLEAMPDTMKAVLLNINPDGFCIVPASLQLLKAQLPPEFQDIADEKNLRKWTFARNDGIRLIPDMVAGKETIQSIHTTLTNALKEHPAYALTAIKDIYDEQLQHLSGSLEDLAMFLKSCVLPSGMSIIGKGQEMMCIASGQSAEATYESLSKIIHDILQEAGDAVSLNDLLQQLLYLNSEIINSLCKEQLGDAICFQLDEQIYWKLLEFYWLPEDFSNLLADIVSRIEEDYSSVSLLQIKQELQQRYGESFEEDYAINDELTLKQIIQAAWNGSEHTWKNGNTWIKKLDRNNETSQKKSISALDAFLEHHHGIFHEDDFLKFARDKRGMRTPNYLIVLAYLIPSCVRINERQWISPGDFEKTCIWDNRTWEAIEQQLQYYLGNKSFFPIKDVPQVFYDSLDTLDINGTKCYWNIYLLSSLCNLKLTKLRIVNTSVAPYATTGQLVPAKAQINEDDKFGLIDYVINSFPRQAGINYTAEDYYAFLNANSIRLRKSAMLLDHLQKLLEGGDNV